MFAAVSWSTPFLAASYLVSVPDGGAPALACGGLVGPTAVHAASGGIGGDRPVYVVDAEGLKRF